MKRNWAFWRIGVTLAIMVLWTACPDPNEPTDEAVLGASIKKAEEALEGIEISDNGDYLMEDTERVTQVEMEAFKKALDTAKAQAAATTDQAELSAAKDALDAAIAAFNQAKKPGKGWGKYVIGPPLDAWITDRYSYTNETWPLTEEDLSYAIKADGTVEVTLTKALAEEPSYGGHDRWVAGVERLYRATAGTRYIYEFEAWTKQGTRVIDLQYYRDEEADAEGNHEELKSLITISENPQPYEVTASKPLPKGGIMRCNFQIGDQAGTFYIKNIRVTPVEGGTPIIPDASLNGTWILTSESNQNVELKLNNGSFESSRDGVSTMKGTYTANAGTMTMKATFIHGDMYGIHTSEMGLTSKWYAEAEFRAALISSQDKLDMSKELIDEYVSSYFSDFAATYTVQGNTLNLKMSVRDETEIYTKK